MTGRLTYLWMGVLLAWAAFMILSAVLGPVAAVLGGIILGGGAAYLLRQGRVLGGLVAVLEPIGVVLPILAIWQMAGAMGLDLPRLSVLELLIYLAAHVALLAASMGALPGEPYRLGYAPLPVGAMVLLACLYGLATGHPLIPLIAVAGQVLWVLGWGSSNWFDHVIHAVMIPAALISLIARVAG